MNTKTLTLLAALAMFSFAPVHAQTQGTNYDESKVPSYTLPDPLVRNNGRPVKNVRTWEKKRRPEILDLFAREVYGRVPGKPADLHFKVLKENPKAFGGLATMREVGIYFNAQETNYMVLLMYVPNNVKGPVPAFVGVNFKGNHATTDDPEVSMPTADQLRRYGPNFQVEPRNTAGDRWPFETILSRGYAIATFHRADVDPDFHDGFKNGVHPLFDAGNPRTAESWGTISAWAWGLSRALDYLETDPAVDAKRVAVFGHSRLGKTALWAGAVDPRFAMVISNDSGCGGAALSRRCFGETVGRINTTFPHWFCDNFKKYNGKENDLPVDQHELLALIAPRPLYVASASEDLWADPYGEYLSLVGAGPVYALYGYETFTDTAMRPVAVPAVKGRMGHHIRQGKHNILIYDWLRYLDFADKFL